MSSTNEPTDEDSSKSDMVRPSLTIRERHANQLDDLASARYATRSEAVRAAIELLNQSVRESGQTNIDQLVTRVQKLETKIDEIADQLGNIEDQFQSGPTGPVGHPPKSGEDSSQLSSAVDVTESGATAKVEEEVFATLTERGSMTVLELAEAVSESELDVHEGVAGLVERDWVTRTDDEQTTKYRVKEIEK